MPLSDAKIKAAKAEGSRYSLLDSDGLYLEVMTSGSKFWRYRFKREGKEHRVSLGEYPVYSLKEARERRDGIKKRVAEGLPVSEKKEKKQDAPTFAVIAAEWLTKYEERSGSAKERGNVRSRLSGHILPYIGERQINAIEPLDVLPLLQRLEVQGKVETAHRVKQICSQIFRYAIATGRTLNDPTINLRGAIMPVAQKHHAAITDPREFGALLRAIDAYPGYIVRCAMLITALTFVRSGELRHMEWPELDFEAAQWRIPAEKMKMKRIHIVPLARQTMDILKELRTVSSGEKYVFPSLRTSDKGRPISDMTVLTALKRMGYDGQMTTHGFRTTASTLLNEQGWPPDAIERQLAHVEGNSVRAAYNHADYLPERRRMMQAWADYLDELKANQP